MRFLLLLLIFGSFGCRESDSNRPNEAGHLVNHHKVKEELLSLERKWLEAEFVLDTGYISTLMDPGFIAISADRISNKQGELDGIYDNISAMRKESIFLDSLKLE